MKHIILVSLIVFTSGLLSAQERVNTKLPEISSNILWSLNKATGWVFNEEQQWIEGNNKIEVSKVSVSKKEEWNKDAYITGRDNFIKMEVREIEIDGSHFYLFTKEMINGYWKYELAYSGWVKENRVKYVVFKKHAARVTQEKLKDVEEYYQDYQSSTFYVGEVIASSDYIREISLRINTIITEHKRSSSSPLLNDTDETTGKLSILYKEIPNGMCRFYISKKTSNNSGYSDAMTYKLDPVTSKLDIWTYAPSKMYYECPKESLSGLIALVTPLQK